MLPRELDLVAEYLDAEQKTMFAIADAELSSGHSVLIEHDAAIWLSLANWNLAGFARIEHGIVRVESDLREKAADSAFDCFKMVSDGVIKNAVPGESY